MNTNEDKRVMTAPPDDGWYQYQKLVLSTLERLEDEIKEMQEKYRDEISGLKNTFREDLSKLKEEIVSVRADLEKNVSRLTTDMKVKALEVQLEEAKEGIIQAKKEQKIESHLEGISKLKWLMIGGIISLGFFVVQLLIKLGFGALGLDT